MVRRKPQWSRIVDASYQIEGGVRAFRQWLRLISHVSWNNNVISAAATRSVILQRHITDEVRGLWP